MRRRTFLGAGARALAGLWVAPHGLAHLWVREPDTLEVHMVSDPRGEHVSFDPVGARVDPGTVIRWVVDANVHTTTAYHPSNDGKPRRIPEGAPPWDSGYLVHPGDHFEITLQEPGVYDYFCRPHEAAGMVGRIVVGRPPFRRDALPAPGALPAAALRTFPAIDLIVANGIVRPALHAPGERS